MYVQVVKFALKPGASSQHFLALTEEMLAWLKQQEGFLGYELYEENGVWLDRVVWQNKTAGEAGLRNFLTTPLAAKIIEFVEDEPQVFFGKPVLTA